MIHNSAIRASQYPDRLGNAKIIALIDPLSFFSAIYAMFGPSLTSVVAPRNPALPREARPEDAQFTLVEHSNIGHASRVIGFVQ